MAAEQVNGGSGSKSSIQEGDQVVLKIDKALKVVQVRKNRKILFEKLHFLIDNAIGCPYGSVFEVKGDKLNLIKSDEDVDELQATLTDNGEKSLEYQPIKSDGQSQKLTRDDVDSLKSQGASGKEIVKQLVENSETFKDRTEFSQAKYKKKKYKKYNAKITILKPSTLLIASMFYSRTSNKICELRPDALSQLLSLANIRANSKVIVMEQCQGLVVGALLDRMGGHGTIVQIHTGDFPNRVALECYGFPSSYMEIVNAFPINKVNSLKAEEVIMKEVDENKQQPPASSSIPSGQQAEDTTPSQIVDAKAEEVIMKEVDENKQFLPASSSSEDTTPPQTVDVEAEEVIMKEVEENKQFLPASSSSEDTTPPQTADVKAKEVIMKEVDEIKEQPPASSSIPSENTTPPQTVDVKAEEEIKNQTEQQSTASSSIPSDQQAEDTAPSQTVDAKAEEVIMKEVDENKQSLPASSSSEDTTPPQTVDAKAEEMIMKEVDENKQQPLEQREVTSSSQKVDNKGEENITKAVDEKTQQPFSKPTDEQSTEVDVKELEKIKRRNKRQLEERNARNALQSKNMDSLVVVCKLDPSAIVLELLEYVAPSRPFVIFSTYKEPLVECYANLKKRGGVVNLQLTETWWRHYQVLPGRTHPLVNMDGSGGYLLSGTTVERPPKSDSLSSKADKPEEREKLPVPPSSERKHSASQTPQEESGEPPAKKAKEQTEASEKRAEIPVTPSSAKKVRASQTREGETGETPVKKWRQRGRRGGRRVKKKGEFPVTHAGEPPAKNVKEQTESPEERAQIPLTPSSEGKVFASQTPQEESGELPVKKRRQRGKRGGRRDKIKSETPVTSSSVEKASAIQTPKSVSGETPAKKPRRRKGRRGGQRRQVGIPVTPSFDNQARPSQRLNFGTGQPPARFAQYSHTPLVAHMPFIQGRSQWGQGGQPHPPPW